MGHKIDALFEEFVCGVGTNNLIGRVMPLCDEPEATGAVHPPLEHNPNVSFLVKDVVSPLGIRGYRVGSLRLLREN